METTTETTYTLAEVAKHNKSPNTWLVIRNKVYDVTKYLDNHPGGGAIIMAVAGGDATQEFDDTGHSVEAEELLKDLHIGDVTSEEFVQVAEAYRPTYETISQVAAVSTAPGKTGPLSSILRIPTRLAVLGGFITVAWFVNRVNWAAVRGQLHGSQSSTLAAGGPIWPLAGILAITELSVGVGLATWAWSKVDVHHDFTAYKPHRQAREDQVHRLPKNPVSEKTVPTSLRPPALDPQRWRSFQLVRRIAVSPNVLRLIFALPRPDDCIGLPTGQHIALQATIGGKVVSRSYTPISNNSDLGKIELLIKVYDGGLMTNHLKGMRIGDTIDIRGPKGGMKYSHEYSEHIGMVAGGSGITPVFQIIRAICEDNSDNTRATLLYANNTVEDILLRDELDAYAQQCPEKFSVHYVLGKPPQDWKGYSGFITTDLLKSHMPAPSKNSKIAMCGPPGMINAMTKNFMQLGFQAPGVISKPTDQVFLF